MGLLATAVRAFQWSLLGEVGSRVIGPLVFIALARILLPEDFGVVAAATVVTSFSQVFWDSGLARALIQREAGDHNTLANAIFWINLALSVLVMAVMWFTAPSLAAFFRDERIADVLRVLSLQAPMAATCAVMTALMQKRFDFRRLFWVRLITTGGPGLASIPLALAGWSYWALVFGTLVGQLLQTLTLWKLVGWHPRRGIVQQNVTDMMGFACWTMLSGMLGWMYGWLDAIIIGRFLGPYDMGVYRTGNTFVMVIFGLLFSPLLPVLYTVFSRAQHDLARLRQALMMIVHALALFAFPIGIGLAIASDVLSLIVFGPRWSGIESVIGILGVVHAVSWLAGANGELYRAIGKPHVETLTMALMVIIYIPVYIVSVQGGLEYFLWARLGLAIMAFVLHVLVCWLVVSIPPLRWARLCVWAAISAIVAGLAASTVPSDLSVALRLAVMSVLGVCTYVTMIVLLEWRFLGKLFTILGASRSSRRLITE